MALVPVAVTLLLIGGVSEYSKDLDAKRDLAFAESEQAFQAGDFSSAQAGFAALGTYRDADERLNEVLDTAEPVMQLVQSAEAAYLDRDYEGAIDILQQVVSDVPGLVAAGDLLASVRATYFDELLLNARLAETSRDWVAVEQALMSARQLFPENTELTERLAFLWNNHAPLAYTRDGAVVISGPYGDDERALTANIDARWPSWSPDRSQVAFIVPTERSTRFDGTIAIMNADGTNLRLTVDRVMPFSPPQWSPDGTRLAYPSVKEFNEDLFSGRISLQMLDIASGQEIDLSGPDLNHAGGASWSPEGDRLAFVSFQMERRRGGGVDLLDGDAYIVDTNTRRLTNLTLGRIEEENWVRWSPAGDQLAILTQPGDWSDPRMMQLFIMDLGLGAEPEEVAADWQISIPAWSPDGSRFAYVTGSDMIRFWSRQGEEWIKVQGQVSAYLSWSPDGDKLFAPTSNPPNPSYVVSVGVRFGELRAVRIDADGLAGGNGMLMWASGTTSYSLGPEPA